MHAVISMCPGVFDCLYLFIFVGMCFAECIVVVFRREKMKSDKFCK